MQTNAVQWKRRQEPLYCCAKNGKESYKNMIVVIPAYQPDEKLLATVGELREKTDYRIVVVNDGSRESCMPIFEELEKHVTVLHHEVNRGKGAALKTAIKYIAENYPADEGIVTVDADGQHLVPDIVRVCEDWAKNPDALVLGSRRFTGNVPFKSRAGNAITRQVFALSTGVKVFDTQTGLRAFAVSRAPMMLEMKGERYEYEINVLLYATRHRVPIREVWIETVYIEDNASSHFNPIRDAWRIYKMILMFVASSIAAFLIDYVLVLLLKPLFGLFMGAPLLAATATARIISSLCNYQINKSLVFESRSKQSIVRYYILAVGIYVANYLLLLGLSSIIPLWIAKLIVEIILYPISFYMQRRFVFVD